VEKVKTKLSYILFLIILLAASSCNTTEPPPNGDKPTLALKLEDVSCTEAWIELTTTNLQLPTTITLKQLNLTGDTTFQIINLNTKDSLLYIDSLLPNQNYIFQSVIHPINQSEAKSNELSVTTMDTTSHNFTFDTITFGTIGSSTLYDVAIINENNIWAVGEILIADTSQNGYTTYNAVHWDGSQWELKSIPFLFQGDSFYNPIYAVFAFNADDIWFGIGNLIHWDGTRFFPVGISSVFQSLVNKIWGSNSNDLYVVGNNGNIAWYNGTLWTKIESGTELNVNDIWGDFNEKTGEWEILAVASNIFSSLEKEVIKINHLNSQILSSDGIDETLRSVWFKSNIKYYTVGSGTYKKNKLSDAIWEGNPLDITNYFENRIRANDINDVFIAGALGELLHFNGVRWKSYLNETGLFNGAYLSAGIKNNILVAVGYEATQAKIIVGNRE